MAEQQQNPTSPHSNENEPAPIPKKKNIFTLVQSWPIKRQLSLAAVVVVAIALFAVIILQSRTADQQLLYANLSAPDAAGVTQWLQAQKIPYTLKDAGKSVWIPMDQIYQTRLDLASNGLPSGGGVGFEIFDKQSFALTDYVQKVNYSRALQGELARTVSSLAMVESTRVHLAIPEKRLFKNQQQPTTASVIVNLVAGRSLSNEQVQGIVHLIAGSVEGLSPEDVKVIDSSGMVLGKAQKEKSDRILSTDMLSFQQKVENQMELRAQELLDRTMGQDNAMVKVTATIDFSKVEKTEELFDADEPVVRSEQVNNESNSTGGGGGIPGVESNLQGNQQGNNSGGPASSKTARTTNYEISKTISHIVNPVGTVTKLSVSILVADKTEKNAETGEITTTPRTKDELRTIQNMVSSAIGLVADRGDIINITSMPFVERPKQVVAESSSVGDSLRNFGPYIKYIVLLLALFALYFFILRPMLKTIKGEVQQHNKTVEQMEREQRMRIEQERAYEPSLPTDQAIDNLRKSIMRENASTTFIIKNWIHEGN